MFEEDGGTSVEIIDDDDMEGEEADKLFVVQVQRSGGQKGVGALQLTSHQTVMAALPVQSPSAVQGPAGAGGLEGSPVTQAHRSAGQSCSPGRIQLS